MAEGGSLIALLTDFGLKDHYAGVMKGVILRINPAVRIVDISHDVASQDVFGAYFTLANSFAYFPDGTVFAAVVDPGVGTERAVIAVETDRHLFLAPDNGLLGFLEKEGKIGRIVRVTNRRYFLEPVSSTFHGRDIFAPVAAHLSLGIDLGELGPPVERLVRLEAPAPKVTREGVIVGEIISIDRFGNLVTNISGARLPESDALEVRIGKKSIRGLSATYGAGRKGALLAIVGSTGNVEISVNQGSAKKKTGARVGDIIRVHHRQP
jgi:hypothetical protein